MALPDLSIHARRSAGVLVGLIPLLCLGGCGGQTPDATAVAPPPPPAPPPTTPVPVKDAATPGFTPLPTAQQVVAPLAAGRADPFAPAFQAGGAPGQQAAPTAVPLPEGFRFTGVIRSGGQSQALVQFGQQAGPICVGQRGHCPGAGAPPLLPAGWNVAAIDVQNGLLSLVQGRQKVTLSL